MHILALCTEARALNRFHHVANPLVTAMFVDRFPLSEIRDWDSYRNGEGLNYPNEFRAMEQFCRDRLPGVRRLADRQKTRAAIDPQQQHRQNPHQGQRIGKISRDTVPLKVKEELYKFFFAFPLFWGSRKLKIHVSTSKYIESDVA